MAESCVPRFGDAELCRLREAAESCTLPQGIVAERCGRNDVWRLIDTVSKRYYAKVWDDEDEFRRELVGLQLANELADGRSGFTSAEIVYVSEADLLFVTAELPGDPVIDLFRNAYRIDKNPLRRKRPIATFRAALQAVLSWLSAFHELSSPSVTPIYDHSDSSIRERINTKLNTVFRGQTFGARLGIQSIPCGFAPQDDMGLVFGDVTLGNFFFDGERIGAVDFEDIGYGAPRRDFVGLRLELNWPFEKLHYWVDREVQFLLAEKALDASPLWEIEMRLLRFENLLKSGNKGSHEIDCERRDLLSLLHVLH